MHRAGAPEEDALCALATAGAAPRAPCYEAYGRSRVKLLHFMPLHATESALAARALSERREVQCPKGKSRMRSAHRFLPLRDLGL